MAQTKGVAKEKSVIEVAQWLMDLDAEASRQGEELPDVQVWVDERGTMFRVFHLKLVPSILSSKPKASGQGKPSKRPPKKPSKAESNGAAQEEPASMNGEGL